jgi:predicted NAD/FAD-binding protein
MNIAVIGTGISGLVCGHLLHEEHDLTFFEANDYVGGHTHTVDVKQDGTSYAVDTGFIVFNDWTYPNFIRILDRLGVESQPTSMSFSVKIEKSGLEYNGASLNTLFAQRSNLFRPSFHRMIRDILRFNREAPALLAVAEASDQVTLMDYLRQNRYSEEFVEHYIIPMGAAIWSADPHRMRGFPARYFVNFFKNHGLLSVSNRPQWRVIKGGSREYVEKMIRPFRNRIRLSAPVEWIRRHEDHVEVKPCAGKPERFDHVIVAAHSDRALRMLADPDNRERDILGAIPYQPNETVLHTDPTVLPKRRRAWASWNYHLLHEQKRPVAVTYNMNILQSLLARDPFCVSLNLNGQVAPDKTLQTFEYHHPVYTAAGVAAQKRWPEINGTRRTWFCGAYWGYGFHEDGVNSALRVCREFGKELDS